MYNAISQEYLVNFKRDGKLVESRLARNRPELESAMTRFERVPLFTVADLRGGPRSRFLLKARCELGTKTWLYFIPLHVETDWAQSRKFRAERAMSSSTSFRKRRKDTRFILRMLGCCWSA
jgi:hypothetical protein